MSRAATGAVAARDMKNFASRAATGAVAARDMKFFMSTTKGHVVITGRKNYESIPEAYRPLRGRTNVVITRNLDYVAEGAEVVHSLEEALSVARHAGETECFVIGGGQIYGQALKEGLVDTQYITQLVRTHSSNNYG